MITLYQFATSPFAEKVRRAMNYKGLEFEIHEVARARIADGDYQHVSSSDKFPAIQDGDAVVCDSTDIVYHLEEAHGGPSLIPADARDAALAHAIEEWADESLYFYEMTMRLTWEHNLDAALDEFAHSLPGVPKPQLKALILKASTQLTQAQGIGRKSREQVVADVARHFHALDGMLVDRPWLVGDALSVADIAVIAQVNALRYAEEAAAELDRKRHIAGWMNRVDQAAPK